MKKRLLALLLAVVMILPTLAMAEDAGTPAPDPIPTITTSRTMSFGMSGTDVLEAQQRLKMYGYYTNTLDGKFGNGVLSAVKAFQKKNGIKETGDADAATLKALFLSTAKKAN